jgi:hypothetical protein
VQGVADKYIRWHRHANARFVHGHAEPVMPPHVCPWAVQAAFRGLLKAVETRYGMQFGMLLESRTTRMLHVYMLFILQMDSH